MAHFLHEMLVKLNDTTTAANSTISIFSPVNCDTLTELLSESDTHDKLLESARLSFFLNFFCFFSHFFVSVVFEN